MSDERKSIIKDEVFTIPNILVYIRIALIPVFVYLYIGAKSNADYCTALAVMTIAFLTDFFDGKIARYFNCVTSLGKIMDPIADKLYQFMVAVCLAVKVPKMTVIVCLLFVKEISMGIMGLMLINRGGEIFSAKWYGKFCTAFVDLTMVFFLITPLRGIDVPSAVMNVLIILCSVILVFTAVMYTKLFAKKIKDTDK